MTAAIIALILGTSGIPASWVPPLPPTDQGVVSALVEHSPRTVEPASLPGDPDDDEDDREYRRRKK